jgi:hypothetical protein
MTTQSCSCCYRFILFDLPELVLLNGHLIYGDATVSYALWTYDYDMDNNTYQIDGYIEFKQQYTQEEVQAKQFFMENACLCLSAATPEDIEYYNAIHTSVRGGWQPATGSPIRTVTPQCHDLDQCMQDDITPHYPTNQI